MGEHVIGAVDEFPEEVGVGVEVDGIRLAVFNLDGAFYAIADRCTHKNGPLHEAGHPRVNSHRCGGSIRGDVDADERTIRCPLHRLKWDLETGQCPVTGARLPTFEVAIVDDEVRVLL